MTEPSQRDAVAYPGEIRVALYHRLHWLWALLARPAVRRGLRLLAWGGFAAWLLFVLLVLVLRYGVLPRVGDYKAEIEQAASEAVGQPVTIGAIAARWQGLNPDLVLSDVRMHDRAGLPAVNLARVEGVLSWHSLWRLRPTLALLAIEGPVLHVRRETDGRITVAGIAAEGDSDPAAIARLLEQRRIRIRDATIVWEDLQRQAPPLVLEDLQLALDNRGRRHRFGLSAVPPEALAARLDIRGEVVGDIGEAFATLAGRIFVQLDYADLAAWRAWIDYPIDLPQGRGALRVWGDLAEAGGTLTADLALEDVRVRLASNLPELDLASLRGRLEGRYKVDEWALRGSKVELLTRQGVRVAPTDFAAEWRQDAAGRVINGSASASYLDFATLAGLAAHVPLDARSRELLQIHRPTGRVTELRASWGVEAQELRRYSLRAGFAGLGLHAAGYLPGAAGLSGRVELSEKGGDLIIDSERSGLSLPAVFPEPDIPLDELKANIHWTVGERGIDIRIARFAFAGPHAAGSASGSYRYGGDGPGEIDLQASIDRADARAVWRYMPHAVNVDARDWLRRGLVGGRGYDGKLVLKGNLADFPFRDGKGGQFIVTAKAADASVDYADGWPAIDGIEADMSFGVGMKIAASDGRILGTRLSGVSVVIPDFESVEEMLLVKGQVQGPTGEFLRFIDSSPVAESIDRFTDGMKAKGNGRLELELDLPLRHLADSRVRGRYRFQNNELALLSALPPLTQVNGLLNFSESSITAQEIVGRVFGGPLKVKVGNAGEKVAVTAGGSAAIAEVSRHFGWPLLDRLSGNAAWQAEIGIRKRTAEVAVTSDLLGISSPLPEPLNKSATSPLPLRIDYSTLDGGRDQFRVTLGQLASGNFIRHPDATVRGVLALGEATAKMPDKGVAVRIAMPSIDLDAWRKLLPEQAAAGDIGAGGIGVGAVPAALTVNLSTPRLHLMGRDFHQTEIRLSPDAGGWRIGLDMREASGDLLWHSAGEGVLEGRMRRLYIRRAAETTVPVGDNLINSLPGMSLVVDDFRVGEMALGKLELKAQNSRGAWNLDRLSLTNPDGRLNGKAVWDNTGAHHTQLQFELDASNAGKLLDRLGYVDAVRLGNAKLAGKLDWQGPLTGIDYPSLNGQMTVSTENGQFKKLEPGVGKLLGLISLQSLPRRLTLDFRDIFSDGLAFDSIESKLVVERGIMRTVKPLRIVAPAALIEMEGETDLRQETQDLRVVVRPELGGLAAVGAAAMVNPVVGAAALVASTVVQNPLNRLFAYRYHVTGTWSDPHIVKAGQSEVKEPAAEQGDRK